MQQAMQAGAKNKSSNNINNTDKYVPFVSSHMHKDLYKCVGETLLQIVEGRVMQKRCRKQLVVNVCVFMSEIDGE